MERTTGQSDPPLAVHGFPTFAAGGAQVRFAAVANHFGPAFRHGVVSLDGDPAWREILRGDLDLSHPSVAPLRRTIGEANLARARRDFDQAAMFAAHGALWRGSAAAP